MDGRWSRRQFLGAVGVAAGGLAVPPSVWLRSGAAPAASASFTGSRSLRAAMHVHGTWSEGVGSWEAQFAQAAANGYDVLYMTDHDMRAMALDYATSLTGAAWDPVVSTGTFARKATTVTGGSVRLLAESASATAAATVTLPVQAKPYAFNRLRTSISGLTIRQKVTRASLTNTAKYDLVVTLSYHPAIGTRPAGTYKLVYRFGGTRSRWTESGGLVGIVRAPTPTAGSSQTLSPEQDAARFWPDMLAIDNSFYGLSFVARSPRRTAVVDVTIAAVTFSRTQNDAPSVSADQAAVVAAYGPRYPGLLVHPTTEISKTLPDMNPFGIPQWFPDYTTLSADHDTSYHQMVAQVHGMHGLISWNHPFGYQTGPLLGAAESAAKRREVFEAMRAVNAFEVDVLEVGYALRGYVDAATHIALWDTFSRNGTFLTGNGTSDDHSGQGWPNLTNGFATGLWSPTATDADVVPALAGGRAYTAHAGRWPGGETDLMVDDSVPMGAVSVATKATRALAVLATNLPSGSTVQVVSGPVDYAAAQDPGTVVVASLPPSAFSYGGVSTLQVDTSSSQFFRAQVLASDGKVVGTGNPVWLLREAPPGGIPAARAVA